MGLFKKSGNDLLAELEEFLRNRWEAETAAERESLAAERTELDADKEEYSKKLEAFTVCDRASRSGTRGNES
jgi:hypothetical protein